MAAREIVLCFALGLTATATAQPAPETWTPISRTAQTITGRVRFAPNEITFQNGKSLPLATGGQMLFRPEPKKEKILAELYRVTSPDDPALENGSKLCKGKPVAYLLVWKSEKTRQRDRSAHIGTVCRSEVHPRFAGRLWALQLRRRVALRRDLHVLPPIGPSDTLALPGPSTQ
jgi:hypothetical protein